MTMERALSTRRASVEKAPFRGASGLREGTVTTVLVTIRDRATHRLDGPVSIRAVGARKKRLDAITALDVRTVEARALTRGVSAPLMEPP
jgi:hypothetical protein